jgi:CheY-like chemotaxis protein/HPt (histidine-containing phosphotransfer) domain-containing protein
MGLNGAGVWRVDRYIEELELEFIAIAGDSIHEIHNLIDQIDEDPEVAPRAIRTIKRLTHTLKGNGGTFGFPNISLVAHRIEDYILHAKPQVDTGDLRRFYDRMDDILIRRLPPDGEADRVVDGLPRAKTFELSEVTRDEVDVVLVMENATQSRLVRREFEACGYSVVLIPNTIEALDYIHRTRPDLVVASPLMPGLSGVELLITLKALPATRVIPCALLTSLADDDPALHALPQEVAVIHKGQRFSDDFAQALAQFKIT